MAGPRITKGEARIHFVRGISKYTFDVLGSFNSLPIPRSQENKSWYINLIRGICILIKGEFAGPAGGINGHEDYWGMWQTATFNGASRFHVVMTQWLVAAAEINAPLPSVYPNFPSYFFPLKRLTEGRRAALKPSGTPGSPLLVLANKHLMKMCLIYSYRKPKNLKPIITHSPPRGLFHYFENQASVSGTL